MFNDVYKNKKVLITGHTGFKGTWLTTWLLNLGAKVIGVSDRIPTEPSMFQELGLANKIDHNILDIRDFEKLKSVMNDSKPDFVFHLAAQAIVSDSYIDPLNTLSSNVMGTAHVMEVIKGYTHPCIAVIITSDKCYDNVEWVWGYKETDHMGGKDVYSASKGAAELVFKSYFHSFIKDNTHGVRVGTGRAGNVIGGGDWANDRIVVDCMKAWNQGESVEIRSPEATRPWQHVLEPLSGYLSQGMHLLQNKNLTGESFNFGPKSEQNRTVVDLLSDLSKHWNFETRDDAYKCTDNVPFHEAGLLKLNCDKALFYLNWQSTLSYPKMIEFVSEWYYNFYKIKGNMLDITIEQIEEYQNIATELNRSWAK